MVVQRFTNLGLTGRGGQSETEEDEEEGEKGEQGDVISDNLGQIGRWEGGREARLESSYFQGRNCPH